MRRGWLGLLLVCGMVGGGAAATPAANGGVAEDAAAAGIPADFSIETLDHGRFELAAQRGSWVVLNLWATWCTPCLKEIPDLADFDAARDDVRVIGLAWEDITPEDMRTFMATHPIAYPVAIVDVYAPPAGLAAPRGLPMTYLIAPDGAVAKRFLGPVTSKELAAAITAASAASAGG